MRDERARAPERANIQDRRDLHAWHALLEPEPPVAGRGDHCSQFSHVNLQNDCWGICEVIAAICTSRRAGLAYRSELKSVKNASIQPRQFFLAFGCFRVKPLNSCPTWLTPIQATMPHHSPLKSSRKSLTHLGSFQGLSSSISYLLAA